MEPLDNPIWHALRGPQRRFALSSGRAVRYDPEVAPFAGIPDAADAAAWADLAALFGPDEVAVLAGPTLEPPATWETLARIPGVQMVGPTAPPGRPVDTRDEVGGGDDRIGTALGTDDVTQMLELVDRTKPGPFLARTVELGGYVGVRRAGRLVAMAGHRMRLAAFTEVSAVCTDVELRGQGIAGSLVDQVVTGIVDHGERPFLHAMLENAPAIRLYESLGFSVRAHLEFLAVRRPRV